MGTPGLKATTQTPSDLKGVFYNSALLASLRQAFLSALTKGFID
jgi:hypothetical protein